MDEIQKLTTVSEILKKLKFKGYTADFDIREGTSMINKETGDEFSPEEITINRIYRFEGDTDPADLSVIYAMESKSGVKGIFLDAYGPYAGHDNHKTTEFLNKVNIDRNY